MTFSARQRAPSFSFDGAAVDHRKMPFMPTPDSSAARCLGRWLAAGALLALIACSRGDSVDERIRQAIVDDYRAQLAKALPADKRATLERQLERLERGEPALDEEESLRLAGYQITKTEASFVYRNRVHGYQINLPEGVELQVHRNGQYVIVKSHGSLFGIWVHADDPIAVAEAKLLGEF
ncbi:MAG TPA: hypothetical protein VK348_12110, partial [Planctomycetota bacterium]|nr:hypothetical protein [Planctomycetota bacterium]